MTTPPATLPDFEIFAPGAHTTKDGETLAFAATDLTATATAYDPARHQAPICIGHPKHDEPAYGWVRGLRVEDGRLVADPEQVDPAFAALVQDGRFKMRSAAFFRPTAADNPVPGTWYLRHVGFLGAAPPAVLGLKPIAFGAADDDTVVFSSALEPSRLAWSLRSIVSLFRGVRDRLVETDGSDKAEALMPSWRLDDLAADAARLDEVPTPAFSAPAPKEDPVTVRTPDPAELTRREAELTQREAQFASQLAEQRRGDDATFLDGLVKQGRLASGLKDDVAAFMATLDSSATVAFAAAGATVEKTPHQAFRDLLSRLPTLVEFRELAADDDKAADTAAFAAPTGYSVDRDRLTIHGKALAYQQANPNTDYATAVRAVGGY